MITNYLPFSLAIATFGFLLWYTASASLRLSQTFQIQFDICHPYANRIYRRRIIIFILYVVVPLLLIYRWKVLGDVTLADLGILFSWNQRALIVTLILVPAALVYHLVYASSDMNLTEYPEIRLTRWTKQLFLLSAFTWCLQIFALEFMFRGFVLQSLLMGGFSEITSALITTGIYSLTHYFKHNRIAVLSIFYGFAACYIVIYTSSILPVFIIHLSNALFSEWTSVRKHPEIRLV